MTFETVHYALSDSVATVTMNRPEALNALSLQLTLDLAAAFRKAIDDRARSIILTGTGRAFCSGGDLREMKSMWEHECQIESGRGDDFREGVAAFFEKRVPNFTGR